MIKLNKEYIAFLSKNAKELLRYINNGVLNKTKAKEFLDKLYDWIDDFGFNDEGYYNDKGVMAQKIYDFVYNA